jgi:nucleoside-diphosphate-sugar epimerase
MKVFVLGATGFIGSAVAHAFARAGHEVFGLARSKEKAAALLLAEIEPVFGSLDDPAGFQAVAERCQVLVQCAVEYSPRMWALYDSVFDALLGFASNSRRERKVITTSGVWVYGDTRGAAVDEGSPLNPPAAVAERPAFDERVLGASTGHIKTIVIRPGCVYGGTGSLTGSWFESAEKGGAARIVGDGGNRWAMVHRDDLADLYVRAAESPCGGELFNGTDRSRFTVLDCARAASRAAGAGGKVEMVSVEEAAKAMGTMAECLALDQHVDSRKAVSLLGWQPRHGGFADGAERYFHSWKAARG